MQALAGLLWAVAFAASAQPAARPQAHPNHVGTSLDKERVAIGEAFTLTIEVTHPEQDTWSLPKPLPLGDLSARAQPQVVRRPGAPGLATTLFTLPLVNLKTLTPRVPELSLLVDGPEGQRSYTVPGQALTLVSLVEPDGQKTKEKGPRAPKQAVPIFVRSYLWAGVLLGAIAFGALLYGAQILGRRAREARDRRNLPPPLAPDAEALQRISDLRARAPWKQGLARSAIFELSEIVRLYLGKRLGFGALDLTSDELIGELRKRRILGLDLAALTEEMSWESLVKFAKVEPSPEECEDALVRAAELVERMRPLPAPAHEARP